MSSKITARRSSVLSLLTALIAPLALLIAFMASLAYTSLVNAAGSITVEIIAGYNLVVDSNVQAPSTAAPHAATVIGRVCNTGTVTLNNVSVSIGDYAHNTPGIYPRRYVTETGFNATPLIDGGGWYAFTHVGGTADATRLIPTLAAGECKVEYWTFSYPRCENVLGSPAEPPCAGDAVWGATNDPTDDLWLKFDVWAAAPSEGSVTTATWRMTMRNEISAMANKIEPNPLGEWFNTEGNLVQPGGLITTNGILYELGRVNQGFDNDGDLAYDYNAWLQPIGDPSFDPTCFRLVRTTGVLTVSRSGTPLASIIPFTDTLYFTDLPADNTGVRGLVFYTFMAIRGSCATAVSPYQEVASGADNEKFNGDYGGAVPPPPGSTEPKISLDKSGNITATTISPNNRITYTVAVTNLGTHVTETLGLPAVGMPLVLSDSVPANTTFITGSQQASVGAMIRYSTDHGQTYTTTPPLAGTITNIQWWFSDTLAAGASAVITFSVQVSPTAGSVVNNCADVSLGGATPLAQDCAPTRILGSYLIGDYVWRDENRDGQQNAADGANPGINAITLTLYYDTNGDRALDSGDLQVMTTTTTLSGALNGYYTFTNLMTGTYLVLVDSSHYPPLPTGYRNTTPLTHAVTLNSGTNPYRLADFGFGPSLSMTKTVSYDGQYVRYSIPVLNQRPGGGETVGNYCRYTVWTSNLNPTFTGSGSKGWLNSQNAVIPPGPDGVYATGPFANATETLGVTDLALGLKPGNILTVEVVLPIQVVGTLAGGFHVAVITPSTTVRTHDSHIFDAGALQTGQLITNVTSDRGTTWSWSDFNGSSLGIYLETFKAGNPGGHLNLDAAGFRVTSDSPCVVGAPSDVMTSVPLTDTYDTSLLRFVSASPSQSSINTTTGVITWTNVGPLDPGQSANVQVTFLALPTTSSFTVTNSACVSGATFSDGQLVNNACANVTRRFTPTGVISGAVWNDLPWRGWYTSTTTGYSGTDQFIPGITVTLYACVDEADGVTLLYPPSTLGQGCNGGSNKGVFTPTQSLLTGPNGEYAFTGLANGFYYVTVTPPAGYFETAEADFAGNGAGRTSTCPGVTCDNTWGQLDPNLASTDLSNFNPINTPGEVITNVNFGYSRTTSIIYGTVWHDHDGDGVRDSGDDGFPVSTSGITVTLTDSSGNITQTKTITNGYYEFTGLGAGTYTITVVTGTLPPGGTWTQTFDPDVTRDDRHTVTIAAGQVSGSHDFGYYQGSGTYEVGDTVYADWNGNGSQNIGEEGLSGITVTLYASTGAAITSTTTNASGYYIFTGLVTGTYRVGVGTSGLPSWWTRYRETQDPDESGVCSICNSLGLVSVSSTLTSVLTIDFGYQPYGFGSIGDYVWYDADADGIQDAGESGIPGAIVRLYENSNGGGLDAGDDALVTYTTSANGYYLFSNLAAGAYLVWVDTISSTSLHDVYGNVYSLTTSSNPFSVTLANAQTYLDADFGFVASGAIGDRVWQDNNGNGNQDLGEPGIPGVTVELYNDTNANGVYDPGTDPLISSTVTIANGFYTFTNRPAGNYVVRVVTTTLPVSTWIQTGDPDISVWNNPCSVACDSLSVFSLRQGQVDMSRDFGYQPPVYIGDRVWLDANHDGVQQSGESGIGGVVLTLTNGVALTTTTDRDGYYIFGNLDPNHNYTVSVNTSTLPSALQPTWEYSTTTDLDSVSAVVISGGAVTNIGVYPCTGCSLAVDFGYAYVTGTYFISGTAYLDRIPTDGYLYKPELAPVPDIPLTTSVLIYLWMDTGGGHFTQIDSTWTNASSGLYTFTNLAEGFYRVSTSPTAPNGLTNTTGNVRTPLTDDPITLNSDPGNEFSINNDFGFAGPEYPTAVTLASFTARSSAGAVVVEWETATESHNLGFNLYRTDSANVLPGPGQRLNASLIPSQSPGDLWGATYTYLDETAASDGTYYYWLEAIDDENVAELYGPVSTTTAVDGTPKTNTVYLPVVIKQAK